MPMLNLEWVRRILRPVDFSTLNCRAAGLVDFLGLQTHAYRTSFPNLSDWSLAEIFLFANATILFEKIYTARTWTGSLMIPW
jgi:hypothetical protein